MSEHAKKSPPHPMIKRTGVGAYRIRPSRERTRKEIAVPPNVKRTGVGAYRIRPSWQRTRKEIAVPPND